MCKNSIGYINFVFSPSSGKIVFSLARIVFFFSSLSLVVPVNTDRQNAAQEKRRRHGSSAAPCVHATQILVLCRFAFFTLKFLRGFLSFLRSTKTFVSHELNWGPSRSRALSLSHTHNTTQGSNSIVLHRYLPKPISPTRPGHRSVILFRVSASVSVTR